METPEQQFLGESILFLNRTDVGENFISDIRESDQLAMNMINPWDFKSHLGNIFPRDGDGHHLGLYHDLAKIGLVSESNCSLIEIQNWFQITRNSLDIFIPEITVYFDRFAEQQKYICESYVWKQFGQALNTEMLTSFTLIEQLLIFSRKHQTSSFVAQVWWKIQREDVKSGILNLYQLELLESHGPLTNIKRKLNSLCQHLERQLRGTSLRVYMLMHFMFSPIIMSQWNEIIFQPWTSRIELYKTICVSMVDGSVMPNPREVRLGRMDGSVSMSGVMTFNQVLRSIEQPKPTVAKKPSPSLEGSENEH